MDQVSNQTFATDATADSSVSSVASSMANLDLNPSPINRLPNKLLQRILSKVERIGPIQEFALLRTVDTRWQSIVDDICKDKKSLLLVIRNQHSRGALQVEDYFFGLLDETDSVRVIIRAYEEESVNTVRDNIFESLHKALPNMKQLYIYCSRFYGLDLQIASYVNSLASLKQLHVCGVFEYFLQYLQLTRLEFFYYIFPHLVNVNEGYYVCSGVLSFDYVRQLHGRAPRWLANVTKLTFPIDLNDDQFCDQIVNFLREHATRLNALHIDKFRDTTLITPALFGHLAKLTQLRTLALGPVQFEVLKQVANAIKLNSPLSTITTCSLIIADLDGRSVTVDQFTRVLVAIFPNVVKWKFAFVPNVPSFEAQLEQKWLNRNVLQMS